MRTKHHLNAERFRKLSPLQHVHHCRTPTLILQGLDDERCPRGQAEELFASLMRCSRTTRAEMVLYPGGDHHFFEQGMPSHRLDVVKRSVAWLERWIDVPVVRAEEQPAENTRMRRVS